MKQAIVLCSGGLDSSVTAYYVKNKLRYDKLIILFFNYNQRTLNEERVSARKISQGLNARFIEIKIDGSEISTSLINNKLKSKKLSRKDLKDTKKEAENWYVPCRNLIFLAQALAFSEAEYIKNKQKNDIFVGFKCEGKESYPDTTKEFVNKMNKIARIFKMKIYAPLIKMDKEDIVLLGMKLGMKLEETYSCYVGKGIHCGKCLACMLRKEGFYWANIPDKTNYLEK